LPTRTASEVVIDQSGLEQLPSIPGRAIYMKESFTVHGVTFFIEVIHVFFPLHRFTHVWF
ncbi:hypothetical protein ACT453_27995, partial [Bacillus sp. D-CC]